MTSTRWLSLILATSFGIRCAWVLLFQAPPESDAGNYDTLAWNLATGNGFSNEDGDLTAYRPVGYPAFLAGIYTAFGHSWLAGGIANAILWTIVGVLTYRLARLFLPTMPSLATTTAVAFLPSQLMGYTAMLLTEPLYSVLVLVVVLATHRTILRATWVNAVVLGLAVGISVYVRPILLFFPIAVVSLLIVCQVVPIKRALVLGAIAISVSFLVISPWSVRNYLALGEPILTASNGGVTFYNGNGPGATGKYRILDREAIFSDISEVGVNREGFQLTIKHLRTKPLEWLRIAPVKFFYLWGGDGFGMTLVPNELKSVGSSLVILSHVYWATIAVAAIVTLALGLRQRYWLKPPASLLLTCLIYWTAFHLMVFGDGRFNMPMFPLVAMIAAHLLLKTYRSCRQNTDNTHVTP